MLTIDDKQNIINMLNSELKIGKDDKKGKKKEGIEADSIKISDTAKAFKKVDEFLNLGKPDRLESVLNMSPGVQEEFFKMLSILLQRGVVGYEMLEVDGKPEKHYMVTQIGDQRIQDAKLYDEDKYKY